MYSFLLAGGMFLADPNPNSMESMTVDRVLNKDNTEEQVSNEKIDSSVIGEDSQFPCENWNF